MNGSFSALLYGRDLPPAGLKVSAQFVGNRLQVGGDLRLEAAADALTIETGGLDHDTLYLGWTDASRGRLSLAPADKVARATLLGSAPAVLGPALRRHQNGGRHDRSKWLVLGGLAGVLALLVVGVLLATHASAVVPSVPRWMVTYSRMVLPSPISTRVASSTFAVLSWLISPKLANWKMVLVRPIRIGPFSTTCGPIVVPSPTSTPGPMIE